MASGQKPAFCVAPSCGRMALLLGAVLSAPAVYHAPAWRELRELQPRQLKDSQLIDKGEQLNDTQYRYDAAIIPCGGVTTDGAPLPWVVTRLDAALNHENESGYFLVLGRGTTHQAPPVDTQTNFPIDEAKASADYLMSKGIESKRIFMETWSLDTIGNAVFARMMHAEPREWTKLLVITSQFHMQRTRAIFDWVFHLQPKNASIYSNSTYELTYEATPDTGMSSSQEKARVDKERGALKSLQETIDNVTDLEHLHEFVFAEHVAYSANDTAPAKDKSDALTSSYAGSSGARKGDR